MLYLDTSVLLASFVREQHTEAVHAWLLAQPTAELAISDWTITEFASALALKRRTRQLTMAESDRAGRAFTVLIREMVGVIPLVRQDFRQAAWFIRSARVGLRAGDALHVAVALREAATLCTLDRRLLRSAQEAGVPVDAVVS